MPDTPAPLFMAQLRLDGHEIGRSAQKQKLPRDAQDLGYILHGHLQELFGELAPKPFRSRRVGRDLEVLGYSSADEPALRAHGATFAEPLALRSLQQLAVKAMPARWEPGQRLGFEVRACPVVRKSSATATRSAGVEVDAFLAAADQAAENEPPSRPKVYRGWLEGQLAGAARLLEVELDQFQLTKLCRRTQGSDRRFRVLQRPEAQFRGELEVSNGEAFAQLLARGVGRHRAFGFGMLLLRPPSRR